MGWWLIVLGGLGSVDPGRVHSSAVASPSHRYFGQTVAAIGDANGDGTPDLLVGEASPDPRQGGEVWGISGRDGSVLWNLASANVGDGFGTEACKVGDVDHDGCGDVIIGTHDRRPGETGYALLVSGRTGAVLRRFVGAPGSAGLGECVGGVGDIDRDGIPDIAMSGVPEGCADPSTLACVFSGADGRELLRVRRDRDRDALRSRPFGLGDVNGDGHGDFALTYWRSEQVHHEIRIISGRDARVLRELPGRDVPPWQGMYLRDARDMDGDGTIDLLAHVGAQELRVLSATSGAKIFGISSNHGALLAICAMSDLDGDGLAEIGISGSTFRVLSSRPDRGAVWLLPDGLPFISPGPVVALGDIDGDGIDEVAAGVDHRRYAGTGGACVFSGRTSAIRFMLMREQAGVSVSTPP